MWKLPNGRTISTPKDVLIDDVNYPANIFRRWSTSKLNELGIYPFREEMYDTKYYKSTERVDTVVSGEITRNHKIAPKYTVTEIGQQFKLTVQRHIFKLWKNANEELEYLDIFDDTNVDDRVVWQDYKLALKQATSTIKFNVKSLNEYADLIAYTRHQWLNDIPSTPFEEQLYDEQVKGLDHEN